MKRSFFEHDKPLLTVMVQADNPWILKYDCLFDRKIDNFKILKVTGLKKEDFTSIRDGIKYELEKINK